MEREERQERDLERRLDLIEQLVQSVHRDVLRLRSAIITTINASATMLLAAFVTGGTDIVGAIQDHIDQVTAGFKQELDAIESEVSALKAQPGAENVNFSALDAQLSRASSDGSAWATAAASPPPAVTSADAGAGTTAAPAPTGAGLPDPGTSPTQTGGVVSGTTPTGAPSTGPTGSDQTGAQTTPAPDTGATASTGTTAPDTGAGGTGTTAGQ